MGRTLRTDGGFLNEPIHAVHDNDVSLGGMGASATHPDIFDPRRAAPTTGRRPSTTRPPGYPREAAGKSSGQQSAANFLIERPPTAGPLIRTGTGVLIAPAGPVDRRQNPEVLVASGQYFIVAEGRFANKRDGLLRQCKADLLRARRAEAPYTGLLEDCLRRIHRLAPSTMANNHRRPRLDAELLDIHRVLALVRRQLGQRPAIRDITRLSDELGRAQRDALPNRNLRCGALSPALRVSLLRQ